MAEAIYRAGPQLDSPVSYVNNTLILLTLDIYQTHGIVCLLVKNITKETQNTMKTFHVEAKQIDRFQVEVVSGDHTIVIDQPKAVGGNGAGCCPVEYVLAGLAACILNVAYVVAGERKIELRGLTVRVEGDLNPARFVGMPTEDRAGFQSIRLIANIDANMTLEEKEDFLRVVEARCPVSDNLANTTPVDVILEEKVRA